MTTDERLGTPGTSALATHLLRRYAALENPDALFDTLDEEATVCYLAIRNGMLKGVNPNNDTITWAEFLDHVARSNQTAGENVGVELIHIPGEDDTDQEGDLDEEAIDDGWEVGPERQAGAGLSARLDRASGAGAGR